MTGKPLAVVDGTVISAKRTAAAAAVALRLVAQPGRTSSVALVGCGPINYEVFRFIAHLYPVERVLLVDLQPERVDAFAHRLAGEFPSVTSKAATLDEALQSADIVSMATNATVPHIPSLPERPFVLLHLSLRDLAPEVITDVYNVVDDVEHVCTARTSLHLAAQATGRRDFIRATIPGLLSGADRYDATTAVPTVISPFGMAILDLAVLREVLARASEFEPIRIADFRDSVWS